MTATTQTRPLLGTRFKLDEEKILRENIYDLDEMYAKIEEFANIAGLSKVAKNHFEFHGEKNAQAHLGILIFNFLSNCEWFAKNVKEWYWLDENEQQDIISLLKKRKKIWQEN